MKEKTLTASEVINLWNSYLTNTMIERVTRYFIAKTQDKEIHQALEYAEEIAMEEVKKAKQFLIEANYPLPNSFDDQDVNINVPPIFTDKFVLILKYIFAQDANVVYSMSLATSTRSDVREYYQACLHHSAELLKRLGETMVKKGLHHPKIHIPIPDKIEKVEKQSFLATGWFSERRPLNVSEINQIEFNYRGSEMQREFLRSFAKLSPTKELSAHFERGAEMLQKHLEVFQSLLSDHDLPQIPTWEGELINTTVSPFSDRLMLYKMSVLTASRSARYGTALSLMQRKDLGVHFMRLMTETLRYGEDCANLMIKYGFMNQLPLAKEKSYQQ